VNGLGGKVRKLVPDGGKIIAPSIIQAKNRVMEILTVSGPVTIRLPLQGKSKT
jgi:hypothetical protein